MKLIITLFLIVLCIFLISCQSPKQIDCRDRLCCYPDKLCIMNNGSYDCIDYSDIDNTTVFYFMAKGNGTPSKEWNNQSWNDQRLEFRVTFTPSNDTTNDSYIK